MGRQWSPRPWLVAVVGLGILCRVRQYAANTSLWHDESFVALNAIQIPLAGLLGRLDWHEPSPPGFLAAEHVMQATFGRSEYVLRALPLLAGGLALVALARLAMRACGDARGALWTVALAALSAKLVADASAVKHFSVDLLAAVLLVDLAWRISRGVAGCARRLLGWGVLGAIALWFSYASAFVFAGTSLVLGASAVSTWPRANRAAYAAANLLALASAAALFGAVRAQRSAAVVEFWARAFPDLDGGLRLVAWLGRALLGLFDFYWQPFGGVVLGLAAGGAYVAWRSERRALLLMLWAPVGLALAAAAVRWWPFGGNHHMAFAAPAILIAAGDGIEIARRRLARRRPSLAAGALALFFAPGAVGALYHLVVPRQRHEVRSAIEFMQAHDEAGDQLAVFDPATFAFYTDRDLRAAPMQFADSARVWVITPRDRRGGLQPDVRALVERLQRTRRVVLASEVHGAAAYCFGPVLNPG